MACECAVGYRISHLPSCCRCYRVNSESTACKRVVTWLGALFWCGGLISAWLGKQISGWWEAGQTEWSERGRDRPGDGTDWKRQLKRTGNVLLTISAVCSMHIVHSIFYKHKIHGWPTTKSKMSWRVIMRNTVSHNAKLSTQPSISELNE